METEIEKAMRVAMQYHQGQTRIGEGGRRVPYYEEHVKKVYEILEQEVGIRDTPLLVMALLHDTLEDTRLTRAQIAESFGDEIARQVDFLTRRKGQPFEEYTNRLFREGDDRAIVVKLADRLHNLRTILWVRDQRWIVKKLRQTQRDILGNLSERNLKEPYRSAARYLEGRIRERVCQVQNSLCLSGEEEEE